MTEVYRKSARGGDFENWTEDEFHAIERALFSMPPYSLTVMDEGNTITSSVTSMNFVGPTVTVTASGNATTVTIVGRLPPSDQSGTTYTFVLGDANVKITRFTSSSPVTATVPPNSSVAYTIGDVIHFKQDGTGQVTIAEGTGVTVNARIGKKSAGRYAMLSLWKEDTNTWTLFGDMTA